MDLDIDVLIDDSPVTLARAIENGMVAATLVHPWNRELCEEEADVVCADDWRGPGRRARAAPAAAAPRGIVSGMIR